MEKKIGLHPRNKHSSRYDFIELTNCLPELKPFVSKNKYNDESIDFANPEAVKKLNQALLKFYYQINNWDIPKNYLCPPIPGRADYIHHVADLLSKSHNGVLPRGDAVLGLDIGIGANCVYPLIASHEYGWKMIGSDIDQTAFSNAQKIINSNSLENKISLRPQQDPKNIFIGIIKENDFFDFTLCNPPFHASAEEAARSSERKIKNLSSQNNHYGKTDKTVLNFGGQNNELWCEGGELVFIGRMIKESIEFKNNCLWFTTLVSKAAILPELYEQLKLAKVCDFKTIDMAQGHKKSRILAWTFKTKVRS